MLRGFAAIVPWLRRLHAADVAASAPMLRMFGALKKRIDSAPASTRAEFHGAYPGGLGEHMALTAETATQMQAALQSSASEPSLILVSLLCDLGKIGDLDRPYYTPQTSDWHRNKGHIYEISTELTVMTAQDRSLWWCGHYGVPLTTEEWQAIRYINSLHGHDNLGRGAVAFHESDLLWVCASAKAWAIRRAKATQVAAPTDGDGGA